MFSTTEDGDLVSGGTHYDPTTTIYRLDGVIKTMAEYTAQFSGATVRTVHFTPPSNAPDQLWYWCHFHTGQGNSIQINQGPWVQLLDKSSSIGELRDVNLSTAPTNGQSLVWDNTNGYWKADTVSGGGGSYANSDVDSHLNLSSANVNEVLSWNGSDYDWVANGGGGGTTLTIQDEGTNLPVAATTINFVGAGVVASGTGATKTITIGTAATAPPTITWTLTAPNSDHYVFSGDGFPSSQNDPTLYLMRGQTYKFVNNTGTTHPFRIQTDGPTNGGGNSYNDGITNNDANNGDTLTFVVPMDAPDTLYYQCTAHTDMFGTINILTQGAPARRTASGTTASIANNTAANITIAAAKTYVLHQIETDQAAWVTLYTDDTSRTSDANRTELEDPVSGSGVIAEIVSTGPAQQKITPGTVGFNYDVTPSTNVYLKVVNKSGSTNTVKVTLTYLALEI